MSFLLIIFSVLRLETVRGCGAFEEIEISTKNCIGDCEEQGQERKLFRLLSRFRPRILTLNSSLPYNPWCFKK
jgi:hypothetical protein